MLHDKHSARNQMINIDREVRMGEDRPIPDWELPRCVSVYVTCMLHADKYIRGNHETYPLGHGRTYQMLGQAACTMCINSGHADRWLKLEFEADPEATVKIPHMEYTMALLDDMHREYGVTEDGEDEGETPEVQPTPAPAPVMLNRPPLTLGGSHT
jgi:hypothetical protein